MTPLAKKLLIALIVSVGLNLVLAGFLAGRAFRPFPPSKPSAGFFGRQPQEFRARMHETREARLKVAEALEREPFDPAALENALSALRAQTKQGQETLHEELLRKAASATPQVRRMIAGHFRRGGFAKKP